MHPAHVHGNGPGQRLVLDQVQDAARPQAGRDLPQHGGGRRPENNDVVKATPSVLSWRNVAQSAVSGSVTVSVEAG